MTTTNQTRPPLAERERCPSCDGWINPITGECRCSS
jgi:hypothetical protein